MGSTSSESERNKNAFEGIAPRSLSDAGEQPQHYPAYDVFINHRGLDVKETLATLIYRHLADFDIRVFLDQKEFQTGDFLPAVIQHALATSSAHVAIFSPRYAESPWCLAELSFMLTTGKIILPIFYGVEPSHLRYIDTGPYAQAFRKYQEKKRIDLQIVHKWKQDLYNVSFVSGIVFNKTKDDEAKQLKSIVERVVQVTRGEVLDVAKHPVGQDEALEAFQNTISQSNEQYGGFAKLVGIVGMGGSGKTTLAKKIYNEKSSAYKGCCCFLSDVRLGAAKSGLTFLQSKVLQKLLHYDWKIDSTSQGIELMRSQLQNHKILLVLDDVDSVDQIDGLLVKDVLGPGSLVILTSRDKGVLLSSGVEIFHEVKGLRESLAREFFCWHAFLRPYPLIEFEALVEKFLIACSGLPLSLKVIGALLYKKGLPFWKGTLEKIGKHILPANIVDTLKISFEALDREEKEIFLDIACFFSGEDKNMLIKIWDASGWSSMQSLENLEQKCLVEFTHQNEGYKNKGEDRVLIRMHDHLRDMGRSVILNQSQPSRLWQAEDIRKYLWQIQLGMFTEVRGIWGSPATSFDPTQGRQTTWNDCWMQILEICSNSRGPRSSAAAVAARALKLLQSEGDSVITEFNHLSRHLIWLRWDDCRYANAPSQLCVPNLRVLELSDVDCNLDTMWKNQAPKQLRELYVRSKISCFTELPKSIGLLRNLEKIVLLRSQITNLPDELCQLPLLKHLDLSHCEYLQSLPSRFGNLRNLRHLDLTNCSGLQALPNSFSELIQLQYLSLLYCKSLMVSSDILRNIVTLEYLDLNSSILETLPTHITKQRPLRNLYVDCPNLKELPAEMKDLCNLRVLEVTSHITSLPSSLMSLSSLKSLTLSNCRRLQCIPESIAQLQALEYLNLHETALQVLPQGVAHLKKLVELYLQYSPVWEIILSNPRDEERPSSIGNPLPIDSLAKAMIRLKSIYLSGTKTTKLCIAKDVCLNLETLEIRSCTYLIQVEALPITLVNLELYMCDRLKKVEGLYNLTKLRYFNISGCFELQGLEDLSELRSLELLTADGCCMLTKMQGLQQLQQLKQVQIAACTAGVWNGIECLKKLPSKVCSITLNMQTVGGEESQVYKILNSLGFPISVLDFQFFSNEGAVCKLELSEVRSCSRLIIILLCESSGERVDYPMQDLLRLGSKYSMQEHKVFVKIKSECQWITLSMFTGGSMYLQELKTIKNEDDIGLYAQMPFNKNKGWVVLLKDKEEWKMTEIWEKLFSYAYSKRAF